MFGVILLYPSWDSNLYVWVFYGVFILLVFKKLSFVASVSGSNVSENLYKWFVNTYLLYLYYVNNIFHLKNGLYKLLAFFKLFIVNVILVSYYFNFNNDWNPIFKRHSYIGYTSFVKNFFLDFKLFNRS